MSCIGVVYVGPCRCGAAKSPSPESLADKGIRMKDLSSQKEHGIKQVVPFQDLATRPSLPEGQPHTVPLKMAEQSVVAWAARAVVLACLLLRL
jgi:hypothetical protein